MSIKKLSAKAIALALSFVMVFGAVTVAAYENNDYDENGYEENGEVAEFALPDMDFEIAFLLDAELVLDEDGELCDDFLYALGLEVNRYRRLYIQWMDTPNQYFNSDGWINRIRQRNWEDRWQLTYRRRYPVAWPLTYDGIEAALLQALKDGFTLEDWDFEVDWSYNSAVLSLSDTVNIPFPEGAERGELPDVELARQLLIENMPDKMYELGWYGEALVYVVPHGPVHYRRFEFNRFGENNAIRIEIMPVRTADGSGIENIVEVSHATEGLGLEVTAERREYIYNLFEGYILPRSGLRTSTVLARYQGVNVDAEPEEYDEEDEATPEYPQATVVRLTVGSTAYTINGVAHTVAVAPFMRDGNVMIPLRAVAEAFDAEVRWDAANRVAYIYVQGAEASFSIIVDTGTTAIVNNHTFVPASVIMSILGVNANVDNGVVYFE